MKTNKKLETKSLKKKKEGEELKLKGLFDHLNQIRTKKDPNYFKDLSEKEQKGFSHWMILTGLSQDVNLIPLCAFLWKDGYYDKIPSSAFYTLLCDLVPVSHGKFGWVKPKKKNLPLLEHIAKWYSISTREAQDYFQLFISNDSGIKELANILEGLGLSDKESEKLLGETLDE